MHNVQFNYSDKHNYYITYVWKCDTNVALSKHHHKGHSSASFPKTSMFITGFRASCAKKKNPMQTPQIGINQEKIKEFGSFKFLPETKKQSIKTLSRLVPETVAKKYLLQPFKSVFNVLMANMHWLMQIESGLSVACLLLVKKWSLSLLEERQSSRQVLSFLL